MNPLSPNSISGSSVNAELMAMRREFDHGFSQPLKSHLATPLNFLSLRFDHDVFAIRAHDITGLHADHRIMPMPSPVSALLGVAGFRGVIAPVFDLAALLGYTRKAAPRWLILINAVEPVALAFDQFEAHFSADPGCLIPAAGSTAVTGKASQLQHYDAVRTDSAVLPIIDLPSLLTSLQRPLNLSTGPRRTTS